MFDNEQVLETRHPSPADTARLRACTDTMRALRAARRALLDAVAELDRAELYAACGQPSTTRLLEELLRVDRGRARALLRDARELVAPAPDGFRPDAAAPEPDLPATAGALTDGAIDPDHVEVVRAAMRRLRGVVAPPLPPAMLTEAEQQLAALARERSPRALADAAAEIADRYDPDGAEPHDAERPTEELHMSVNRRGECTGRFRFADPEAGQALVEEITARTPPPDPDDLTTPLHPGRELAERRAEGLRLLVDDARRSHPGGDADVSCDECDGPSDADTDTARRIADDGKDLAGANGDTPSHDHRRTERPSRETTMIVTVPLEQLTQRVAEPGLDLGLIDGRYRISAETARRLACDAAVVPAVLGSRREVLDLGRKTRVVSTAQRRAVIARDRHCAFPGCRRSPRHCEVHHVVPCAQGGPTDLDQLVLLCSRHHHQIHHSPRAVVMAEGRPSFIPPAYLDPGRRPRSNGVHDLPDVA